MRQNRMIKRDWALYSGLGLAERGSATTAVLGALLVMGSGCFRDGAGSRRPVLGCGGGVVETGAGCSVAASLDARRNG